MTVMYNSKAKSLCQQKKIKFLFNTKKSSIEYDYINSPTLFSHLLIKFFAYKQKVCNLENTFPSTLVRNNALYKPMLLRRGL